MAASAIQGTGHPDDDLADRDGGEAEEAGEVRTAQLIVSVARLCLRFA